MKHTVFLFLLVFLTIGNFLFCQEIKVEKEERLNSSEVPSLSTSWLQEVFPKSLNVKWYKEITSGKASYEAKFKYDKKKYSVEFSDNGEFEDIEFLVQWKSLEESLRTQLLGYLIEFEKIKIKKVQKQWTSKSKDRLKSAILNMDALLITERYEVVFQAKKQGKYHIWEALLSKDRLISVQEVVLRSTVNLDF